MSVATHQAHRKDKKSLDNTIKYKFITVDDIEIGYREAGFRNENILFILHGYPSS